MTCHCCEPHEQEKPSLIIRGDEETVEALTRHWNQRSSMIVKIEADDETLLFDGLLSSIGVRVEHGRIDRKVDVAIYCAPRREA